MSSAPHNPVEKEDMLSYWLAKSLNQSLVVQSNFRVSDKPALNIEVINNKDKNKKINIDFLEPDLFSFDINPEDSVEENPSFIN